MNERSGTEYEDVLSSVRRLVTAEVRKSLGTTPREKLVLTPSLRVDEAEEAPPPLRVLTLEERIAELEAAVSASPSEFEPDGSEDQAQHRPEAVILRPAPELDPAEEPGEAPMLLNAEEDPAERPSSGEVLIAQFGRGRKRPAPEPVEEPAPEVVPAEEKVVVEVTADIAADAEPEEDGEGTAELVLDDDSLRAIVSEMIREELQGALGERITRNVRKLVRAEINRAFAARDLD